MKWGETSLARQATSIGPAAGQGARASLRAPTQVQAPPRSCGFPRLQLGPSARPRTYSCHSAPHFQGQSSSVCSSGRLHALP